MAVNAREVAELAHVDLQNPRSRPAQVQTVPLQFAMKTVGHTSRGTDEAGSLFPTQFRFAGDSASRVSSAP
ncbi:MAG TPA: hypothetical protein VGA56_20110, partial [Opitutaceae bacterium]